MNTTDPIKTLQLAVTTLAGCCDGARTEDGAGFNKLDADFGRSLARQTKWTPKQAVAAQKMLRKYIGQLGLRGIDLSGLPALDLDTLMKQTPAEPKIRSQVMLSSDGKFVEFYFQYNTTEKDFIKQHLRARFQNTERKYWRMALTEADAEAIRYYAAEFGADVAPEIYERLDARAAVAGTRTELSTATDASLDDYDLSGLHIELYPFQRAGVKYALEKRRVLIADDMGLGKTFQALAVIAAARLEKFIVVCPASVKINWQRSVAQALGADVTTSVWDGKGGRSDVRCIIINYDNLRKRASELRAFGADCLVVDECHYIKSAKAQRTTALHAIADGIPYVVALTGTPIMNRPDELVSPLQLLGQLDEFGGWYPFVSRYCKAYKRTIWVKGRNGAFQKTIWDTSGAANLQELNDRLRATCMVRRRKVDVLTELPAKQRAQVVFEIDNRKEYEDAENNLIDYLKACAAEDDAFLETVKHLPKDEQQRRVREYQAEATKAAERAEQLVFIETAKQIAVRGKLAAAKTWIADFLETGEKLVVFAVHRSAQSELLAEYPGAARIVAEDSAEERQRNIDRFRKDDTCRLMVSSLGAGGTGVDGLQEVCSNVAFLELGWTPAGHLQAEDRCHRIGQNDQMTAWYLLAERTIEEDIQAMLATKQAVCDSALDGAPEQAEGSVFNDLLDAMKLKTPAAGRKANRRQRAAK